MTERKLKIGFVFDDSLDRTDGVQQYIRTLSEWLIKEGHQVRFLVGQTKSAGSLQPYVYSLARNLKVRSNRNRLTIPLPAQKPLVRWALRREHFDVLHVQMPFSPLMAGKVIKLADHSTAVIGTFHIVANSWWTRVGSRVLALWERSTLRRFDHIVSVSDAAQKYAKDYFGLKSDVVPNAVDLSRFRVARDNQRPKTKTILFLGRLVERKGCQHLLKALGELRREQKLVGWKVLIVGDGPLKSILEERSQALGLHKHVEFVGYVEEAAKAEYLRQADLAVFPATGGESFGIVLLEAMAANHPIVVGGDNPGYRYVLGPRAKHVLIDPLDAKAFAARLDMLMTDTKLQSELRQWQQERVNEFDIETVGPKILKLYQRSANEWDARSD